MVDWLYHNVEGFTDRERPASMPATCRKAGFIRHTVNKITFSEQCYYISATSVAVRASQPPAPVSWLKVGVAWVDVAADSREPRFRGSRAGGAST